MNRVCQRAEIAPLQLRDTLPVVIGFQKPVFLLIVFWPRLDQRNVYDIEQARVAAILILPLVFRNLLVLPRTYGPDPADAFVSGKLDAGDAATIELPRIGKAHEALDYIHGQLPF